jgi:D-alanyl-D-alanine carboxypeptidase
MRHAKWFLIIALAGLVRADRVDDIVKAEMARQHIPGLALAVMKDGRIVRSGGYGLANVELGVPVTAKTVFKIGSLSKQFLAAATMILVQEGKVRLDDGVQKFLEDAPPAWSGITVRRLLSHTSGLVREGPAFDGLKAQPDIQVIRSAYPLALAFAPGERWQYSNIGYFTIAEILTRASGKPWPDFVASRIFAPLGMNATRTTTWRDLVPNRADGYEWQDGKLLRARESLALRPSGAFVSTVEDIAKWDAALYTDAPLTKASRERMWTPVALNNRTSSGYGLGWSVEVRAGKRSIHHGGSLTGFKSYIARFPDDRLSFVVLTNGGHVNPDTVLWSVATVWLPGVDMKPPPISLDAKTLSRYAGTYQAGARTFVVTSESGHLTIEPKGQSKGEYVPFSRTEFFLPDNGSSRASFVIAAGKATEMRLGSTVAKRME